MKKLLFILFVFFVFACNKNDDEHQENPNENYIKFTSVAPKSGSVIREPITVKANVVYNISLNELDGLGFFISLWHSSGKNSDWYSSPDLNAKLERRSDKKLIPIEFIDDGFLKNHKGDSIFYRISITKKISEDKERFLVHSDSIFFMFD